MPNSFFWYDLMTTDTKAAQKFYCDVVGWTAQDDERLGPEDLHCPQHQWSRAWPG